MNYQNISQIYINGSRRTSSDGQTRSIIHPASGEVVATVSEATSDDTTAAIQAARNAFDNGHWGSFGAEQRSKILAQVGSD